MTVIFFILLLLLICIIHRLWNIRSILNISRKLRNKYVAWPVIGHGLMFLGTGEDRMKALQNLAREALKSEYGLTSVWVGPQYFALTCDPLISNVVSKSSLEKPFYEIASHLVGNGTLIAPVKIWRPRRKIMASMFSSKILNSFIDIFVEQSSIMMRCLKPRVGEDTFSVWSYVTTYTFDSICKTALGMEMKAHLQEGHPFVQAFGEYSKMTAERLLKPWLHLNLIYKLLPVYQEQEKKRKILHDTVDEVIKKKKCLLQNEDVHPENGIINNNNARVQSFLDLLLKHDEADSFSDVEIREEILVLMLAGTDTSAVGIGFTMLMLSRNSKVQEKAYEEVREIFGDSKRPITLEDLSKLKYVDAVIRETLRLYPAVPVIVRQNVEDVKLSSEITLPAGSCVCIHIWGVLRNPRYWGADAEEFNPDRFLNRKVSPAAAYMTFSYGPRNCLGYKYAMMSMKVAVTTSLRHYRVLPPSDLSAEDLKKPLRVEFDIMMKDVDNFKVRLEERK